jgi:hypothetical protein
MPKKNEPAVSKKHDLQLWLEQSSDGSQPISLWRHGLAGNLFEATCRLLSSLQEAAEVSDKVTLEAKQQCQNEIERLFLWGDGFGAGDGSLDDVLDKSTELKTSVLSLLSELGEVTTRSMRKLHF